MPLADWEIEDLKLVDPCVPRQYFGALSFGLEPSGYDIRLGDQIGKWHMGQIVDPCQNILPEHLHMINIGTGHPAYMLGPDEMCLAKSFETFRLPPNIDAVALDKSTLVRCGLTVQNTKLACGWGGELTLELKNEGPHTIALREGMPIAQVEFRRVDKPLTVYKGRYQNQKGVVPARLVRKPEC